MTVEVLRNLRRSLIINSKAGIHSVLMNSVWLSTKELSVVKYSKLAKVTTFVTFRISSLWGSLLSWGHYYRWGHYFQKQKMLCRVDTSDFKINAVAVEFFALKIGRTDQKYSCYLLSKQECGSQLQAWDEF